MKKSTLYILFFSIIFTLNSCKKVEGEGGRSSISGVVMIEEKLYVNSNYSSSAYYTGATEDVYIIYGEDGTVIDDDVECSYDGSFKFDYLRPGKYQIFAYNKIFNKGPNVTNNDDDYYVEEALVYQVELGKNEQYVMDTIHLIR